MFITWIFEILFAGGGGSEKNYGYDDLPTSEPSSTGRNSTLLSLNDFEDTETLEKSRVESGMEWSYETLKSGFRNKGYTWPLTTL